MNVVAIFDPTLSFPNIVSGTFNAITQVGSKMLVCNETNANIQLKFPNGASSVVLANDKRFYCLKDAMAQPGSIYTWTILSYIENANTVNNFYVEVFDPNEQVVENYPSPIIRQSNTAVTANNTLSNTGNPVTTQVITIQPSDATSPTFSVDNTGATTINGDNGGILTQLLKLISGVSPRSIIGSTGATTEVGGLLQLDGNETYTSSNIIIKIPVNGQISWEDSSGTLLANLGSQSGSPPITHNDGFSIPKLYLSSGRLRAINGGNNPASSGTTISHGMGVTPDFVIATPTVAQPGSGTVGIDNLTSTTFQVTIGAGSSVYWWGAKQA